MIVIIMLLLAPAIGIIFGVFHGLHMVISTTRQEKRERLEAIRRAEREALEKLEHEEAKEEKRRFDIEEEIAHIENMVERWQALYDESTPKQKLTIDNNCYRMRKKLNKLYDELNEL